MKLFRAICSATFLILCTSCAHLASPLSSDAEADHKTGIIYGRFHTSDAPYWGFKVALWLQNLDTRSPVYIGFFHDQQVYAIQVPPGRYQVTGFTSFERGHGMKGRTPFPSDFPLSKPFDLPAGSQIYLGDFYGHASYDMMYEHWGISAFTNNFGDTTIEYRQKYPHLITAPVKRAFSP